MTAHGKLSVRSAGRAVFHRWTVLTLIAAALIGIGAAVWLAPRWQQRRMLDAIVSDKQAERERAWRWLGAHLQIDLQDTQPDRTLLHEITSRLAGGGDRALLDAGVELRKLKLWNWSQIPDELLLRELNVRAATGDVDQHRVVLHLMADVPLDMPTDAVIPIFAELLHSDNFSVRSAAFEAAWQWAGPDHAADVAALVDHSHDRRKRRMNAIALGWAARLSGATIAGNLFAAPPDAQRGSGSLDDAQWLGEVLARPDKSRLLEIAEHADNELASVVAEIARFLDETQARRVLELLDERGNATAGFALQAMDPARDQQVAREVVNDPAAQRWRRRLAAWRLPSVSHDQLDDLLFIEQTDPPQPVYDVALLAEQHYRRDDLTALAETWMRSMNDDKKRAALLLHTLGYDTGSPVHHKVMQADGAYLEPLLFTGPENRALHLALCTSSGAIGLSTTRATPVDFEPDIALMMLAAGNVDVLQHLTSQPPAGGDHTNITRRAWLIERFVPFWHEQLGRPVGGSRAALRLHFDALEALRLVTQRRLQFNRRQRVFEYQPASAPPTSPGPET